MKTFAPSAFTGGSMTSEKPYSIELTEQGGARLVDNRPTREKLLDTARQLISGDRQNTYGDATEGFTQIGRLWGVVLGTAPVPAWKVALCLSMVKVSRLVATSGAHEDSWVDLCGYAALGGEIGIPSGPLGSDK